MKITIYDVAKQAGVSISTVSKVINHRAVRKQTREKVLSVIEQLQFQPSGVAAALTLKKTLIIAIFIPTIKNPYFAEILQGVEDMSAEMGFSVVICNTDNSPEKERNAIDALTSKGVDGFIFASVEEGGGKINKLIESGFPIALISRDLPDLPVDVVLSDDFQGGYIGTKHLIELGHTEIALLTGPLNIRSSCERLRGYTQALVEAGLPFRNELIFSRSYDLEFGEKAVSELMAIESKCTAIFAANDLVAIGAIYGLYRLGKSVPQDLSIVGFDGTILSQTSIPPLTTVSQPMYSMGREVVRLLIERINHKDKSPTRLVLQPELSIRNSTRPL